jgi:hypothetical protein
MTSTVHSGCQCADLVGHPQKVVVYPTGLMVPNECPKVRRAIERSSAQSVRLQSRVGSRLLPRRVGNQHSRGSFLGSDSPLVVQVDTLPITRAWSRSSLSRPYI